MAAVVAVANAVAAAFNFFGSRRKKGPTGPSQAQIAAEKVFAQLKESQNDLKRVRELRDQQNKEVNQKTLEIRDRMVTMTKEILNADEEQRAERMEQSRQQLESDIQQMPREEQQRFEENLLEELMLEYLVERDARKELLRWAYSPQWDSSIRFGPPPAPLAGPTPAGGGSALRTPAYASYPAGALRNQVDKTALKTFGMEANLAIGDDPSRPPLKVFVQELECAQFPEDLGTRLGNFVSEFGEFGPSEYVASFLGCIAEGLSPEGPGEKVGICWESFGADSLEDICFNTTEPYSSQFAIGIVDQIVMGLQDLHDAGLYHGGLKPSNIRVGKVVPDGAVAAVPRVKLVEAGMSRYRDGFFQYSATQRSVSTNKVGKKVTLWVTERELLTLDRSRMEALERPQGGERVGWRYPSSGIYDYVDPAIGTKALSRVTQDELQGLDKFLLGLVILGIFSRHRVSNRSEVGKEAMRRLISGQRPPMPDCLPAGLKDIVSRLLAQSAADRPSLQEVFEAVQSVKGEFESGSAQNIDIVPSRNEDLAWVPARAGGSSP